MYQRQQQSNRHILELLQIEERHELIDSEIRWCQEPIDSEIQREIEERYRIFSQQEWWNRFFENHRPGMETRRPGIENHRPRVERVEDPSHELNPCPVCLDPVLNILRRGFKIKFLHCGHVVCEECMRSILDAGIPRCPLCRVELLVDGDIRVFDIHL